MLAAISPAATLEEDTDGRGRRRIVLDKLLDIGTTAAGTGVTFIPSVFGAPHLVSVHAPGWQPVLQYSVAQPGTAGRVPMDVVVRRLQALAHPLRPRLVRTLARGPHTTGELAAERELTAPRSPATSPRCAAPVC
ncbi:DUF5937 family protein [Streptomyces sp. E-08]|uniref:DUF5937 family protein n=1 Tax=Streptomyces sp. E-08 TaxID=3404047 RepID=UPI003CF057A2